MPRHVSPRRGPSRHLLARAVVAGGVALAVAGLSLVAVLGLAGWRIPAASSAGRALPSRATTAPATSTPATSGATSGTTQGTTQTSTPPDPAPLSVVGLGDSVTSGSNCDCATFVERFATLLQARDSRVVNSTNLGVPGFTTATLATQLGQPGPSASVGSADIVLVTIGANDLGSLEDHWEHYGCDAACIQPVVAAMARGLAPDLARIKALGHPGQRVEVTTYWNVFEDGDVADQERGAGFADWSDGVTLAANRAICATASAYGDACVDLYAPFLSADGNRNPTPLLSSDGDHPNAAGHQVIAQALLAATPPEQPAG